MGARARPAANRRRSICSCWASTSATSSSACSRRSATKATRCGCCSSGASRRPTPSAAFYRWLREDFAADAVLHFGTHGALEFMPGKQAGLSGECWPDRLIGDLPNFYLYASNNPSEGMIAKRRAGAALISYLTPPVAQAGLYRGLVDLKASLDRWRALPPDADLEQRHRWRQLIQAQAAAVDLARAEPLWDGAPKPRSTRSAALLELEYTLIPLRPACHRRSRRRARAARARCWTPPASTDGRAARRARCACSRPITRCRPFCTRSTAAICGRRRAAICCATPKFCRPAAICTASIRSASRAHSRCRTARGRPTGCWRAIAAEGGALPETVAMVLWGTDNLKTEGGPIAQALWLLGAEPRCDSYGRLSGRELVPLETLGPAAHRRRRHAVRHFPRPAAVADQSCWPRRRCWPPPPTSRSSRISCASTRLAFQARTWRDDRGGGAARLWQRRRRLRRERQSAGRQRRLERRGRACRRLSDRRKGSPTASAGARERQMRSCRSSWPRVDIAYQNLNSIELGVTTVDHYFDTLGGISRAVRRARGGTAAGGLYRRPDPRRRRRPHHRRTGRAGDPHPGTQSEMVRGAARARLRRRARDRSARHQHAGLVGDDRRGGAVGL